MTFEIEFRESLDDLDPEDDNCDVWVRLDDGRAYSITVATPKNIYWCMDNEGIDFFIGCPPLLVRRLDRDNIERAIRTLVDDVDFLPVYGVLMTSDD